MSNIKHLIFDCDGVLIDSEIIAAQVMVEVLGKFGINITIDYYLRNCTGKTYSGLQEELAEEFNTPLPSQFLKEVTNEVDIRLNTQLQPIKDIHKVLESTSLPKSVVSNSDVCQVQYAINHVNIAHHFDYLFSSQMVDKPKPDPGVYLLAAKKLDTNPKNCLVVEDSIAGATAALGAGMNVIGFLGGSHIVEGHGEKLMKLGVKRVTKNANELRQMIEVYCH